MMKNNIKKSLSLILALAMICSVFVTVTIPTQAAGAIYGGTHTGYTSANQVRYVYDEVDGKQYIYNWGARGEEATFLTTYAVAFYSKSGYGYDTISQLSGSATEKNVPSSSIYKKLSTIMKSEQTYQTSYEATKKLFKYTDSVNGSPSGISSFYSGVKIGPNWDGGWNREHCWPNSKGDASGNGENDIMMLRPTSTSENSSRGNKAYGQSSGYYNPNSESESRLDLRGDVARLVLYTYVRWECTNTGSSYNPNGIFGKDGIFESIEVLLEWIEIDPVDTWEIGRNDAVQSITGTRNVFVDYPEYAFILFGEEIPADLVTPSRGNGNAGGSGSGGSGSTTPEDPDPVEPEDKPEIEPETPIGSGARFEFGANGNASHTDGTAATTYTEINNGFTLNITGGTKMYTGARDLAGNSCIKLGTGSDVGSFSFTVPDGVESVIVYAGQYKDNASVISINDKTTTLTKSSNDGEYNAIAVEVSSGDEVKVSTTSGGKRCMINAIAFIVESTDEPDEPGAGTPEPEEPLVCQHTNIVAIGAYQAATCTKDGTTSGEKCADCGYVIAEQTKIDAQGHKYENGKCSACGAKDPNAITGYVFEKVTSDLGDWSGVYLIVYDAEGYAFDGSLTSIDAANNYVEVTIDENYIVGDYLKNAFTIEAISGGYSIKSAAGKYIGRSGTSNGIDTGANAMVNIITYTSSGVTIKGTGGHKLLFNASSNNLRFRYYGSAQKAITLYKLVEAEPAPEIEAPKITGYNVTLNGGTTIKVKCNVSAGWIAANPDATIFFENKFGTTQLEIKEGENEYSITLTPKAINEKLYFVVSDGINKTSTEVSYSIYAEAAKQLEGYKGLGDLLDAIDNYTKAANSSTDMIGYTQESFNGVADWNPAVSGNIFTKISANLGQQITAKIKVDTSKNYEGYKVTVKLGNIELITNADFASYITSNGELVVKGLAPTHLNDELTVTVYNNGQTMASASFNLNSYLKSIYVSESSSDYYKNMAAVTYRYGVAAEAYNPAQ